MTDFDRSISNGTMRIRDVGDGWVEFWFITSSSTYNHQQNWHAFFDGAWHDYQYDLQRGGIWQRFGRTFLTASQNVTFRLDGAGLGWPTSDLVAFINRLTAPPPPPVKPYIYDVGKDYVDFGWGGDGGVGGASITGREFWWSYDKVARFLIANGGARNVLGGLSPGARYYLWAKNANAVGWSGLSEYSEFRTDNVPDAPLPPSIVATGPTSARGGYRTPDPWNGGQPILERQIGYGLSTSGPTILFSGTSINLTGLQLAKVYYFWARARNAIGWGPWSIRVDVPLIAGAWVNVGGVWKRAVPWVRVGGVWKNTLPNTPLNGAWKATKS